MSTDLPSVSDAAVRVGNFGTYNSVLLLDHLFTISISDAAVRVARWSLPSPSTLASMMTYSSTRSSCVLILPLHKPIMIIPLISVRTGGTEENLCLRRLTYVTCGVDATEILSRSRSDKIYSKIISDK